MESMLIIYNPKSGTGKIVKKIDWIVNTLKKKYIIDLYAPRPNEWIRDKIKSLEKHYDVFLAIGGDGTINAVVSGVTDLDYIPKMAIIPQGTVNDMARNFGMPMSTKKSLKVLMNNDCTRPHNIYRINDGYFDYTFALGVCSGVSYIDHKPLGPLSYYLTAVKLFFKDKDVNLKMKINGETIEGKYKFVLITNSEHIGGFKVKFYDKLAVVLIKGKRLFFPFQLLWYSLTSRAKQKYLTDNLEIEADSSKYNADGEGVDFVKNIKIEKAKTINFLCTKRAKRRYDRMLKKTK